MLNGRASHKDGVGASKTIKVKDKDGLASQMTQERSISIERGYESKSKNLRGSVSPKHNRFNDQQVRRHRASQYGQKFVTTTNNTTATHMDQSINHSSSITSLPKIVTEAADKGSVYTMTHNRRLGSHRPSHQKIGNQKQSSMSHHHSPRQNGKRQYQYVTHRNQDSNKKSTI